MSTLIVILVSVALGFSWGIQHEKKRIKKQIQKHGDSKRMEFMEAFSSDREQDAAAEIDHIDQVM